jgi:hypothetical protein
VKEEDAGVCGKITTMASELKAKRLDMPSGNTVLLLLRSELM